MEQSSSYYLELQESRFKQQKAELEEVINRISRIRCGGGGGGEGGRELEAELERAQNEAQQLRNRLQITEKELEKEKESNRLLTEENDQRKQESFSQTRTKRPAIDPEQVTQAGQEAEKFKNLYRECLMKDIPPEMTFSKARIITIYINSLITSSSSGKIIGTRQEALKRIELKYKTILKNLKLLSQHIEKEKRDNDDDNPKTRKDLLTKLYDEIKQEAQRMRLDSGEPH